MGDSQRIVIVGYDAILVSSLRQRLEGVTLETYMGDTSPTISTFNVNTPYMQIPESRSRRGKGEKRRNRRERWT